MCKILCVKQVMKKVNIEVCVSKLAKYVRNCVVFWKNLNSWQKIYTTAGREKFQVWTNIQREKVACT